MDKQSNFVLQKLLFLLNEKEMTPITDEIFQIFPHLIYNATGVSLLINLILTNKSSGIDVVSLLLFNNSNKKI